MSYSNYLAREKVNKDNTSLYIANSTQNILKENDNENSISGDINSFYSNNIQYNTHNESNINQTFKNSFVIEINNDGKLASLHK